MLVLVLTVGCDNKSSGATDRLSDTTSPATAATSTGLTRPEAPTLAEAVFDVPAMYCATCPVTVKTAAKKVPGVRDVRVSLEEKRAWVTFDPSVTNPAVIAKAITDSGYPASVREGGSKPKG